MILKGDVKFLQLLEFCMLVSYQGNPMLFFFYIYILKKKKNCLIVHVSYVLLFLYIVVYRVVEDYSQDQATG